MTTRRWLLGLGAALSLALPAGAQVYEVVGPDLSHYSASGTSTWAWDGPHMVAFRAAVEDNSNFGASGTVQARVRTSSLPVIDATTLAGAECFAVSFWADADTTDAEADAILAFFLGGGDLLLLQDGSAYDKLGERLGVPTVGSSSGSLSTGEGPLFEGPFGAPLQVAQWGLTGYLSGEDVAAQGGHVGAVNAGGQVTAAYWSRGEYAPGAGNLLICADMDMVSDQSADYVTMNDNAQFALNGVSFLLFGFSLGLPYCAGDGSGEYCTCGNLGQTGAGCANSTGFGGALYANGSTDLSADSFEFLALQLPPGRSGVLLQGDGQTFQLFRDGFLCVGGATDRLEYLVADAGGAMHSALGAGDLTGVSPGETRYYQLWYRDSMGPCATGSNLTNAIRIQWQ